MTKPIMKNKNFNKRHAKVGLKTPDSKVFNSQAIHLLKWMTLTTKCSDKLMKPLLRYMKRINHISSHRGIKFAVNYNKLVRLSFTRYLANHLSVLGGIRLRLDGLAYCLYHLSPYLHNDNKEICRQDIQIIMTMLSCPRALRLTVNPDFSSITTTGSVIKMGKYNDSFRRFVKRLKKLSPNNFAKRKKSLLLRNPSFSAYHLSTKIGPSSMQSTYSCLNDLGNLPSHLIRSMKMLGGSEFRKQLDSLLLSYPELARIFDQPIGIKTPIRRISVFPDSEGKTRIIAIGDYWSQTVLRPIHDVIYSVLQDIPADQTFCQAEGISALLSMDTKHFCFDLTAFTDRFPMTIVKGLLSVLVGAEKAEAWYNLMCGEPFDYKGRKITYEVGNPMGFYTSWALTTLAHHWVLFEAAVRAKKLDTYQSSYKLLGDDIVISEADLAREYQAILAEIGVEISSAKTHISNCFVEFAKRFFINVGEISPVSNKGINEHSKNFSALIEFLYILEGRGLNFSHSLLDSAFSYYCIRNTVRSKDKPRIRNRIEEAQLLYKVRVGIANPINLVNHYLIRFAFPVLTCNMRPIAEAIISNVTVQLFEQSAAKFVGDKHDRLFKALVLYSSFPTVINSGRSHPCLKDIPLVQMTDQTSIIYSHPYSFIIGEFVEQAYIKAMKEAFTIDTSGRGFWGPDLRVLIGADANTILKDRNYVLTSRVSTLFLDTLRSSLKTLAIYS